MLRLPRPARNEGGWFQQLVMFAAVSLLSGLLIAGMALPWVGLLSKGAETSAEAMKNFALPLKFGPLNERTRVLASDGTRIAVLYDENRLQVPLDRVAPEMQQAIIAIEDSRFYEHGALDLKGTLRALLVNQASSDVVQGGSSITQQLVKLTLLDNATTAKARAEATARSYTRKIAELRYAVWVEEHLTKEEILERYLNAAYFGDGAYGVEAAARHYFSTTAAELTLRQAALLAGVVKNPTSYDPTNYEDSARERRNVVLERMHELDLVGKRKLNKATRSPLNLEVTANSNGCVDSPAPFFCAYLLKYLLDSPSLGKTIEERRSLLYGSGLTITTTLDLRFQEAADDSVTQHVYPRDRAIGALAMVEPGTGYVRALSQSRPMGRRDGLGETFVNYTVPFRYGGSRGFQPGSTFKAFVLTKAIKMGIPLNKKIYAPKTLRGKSQTEFTTCGGKPFPNNAPYKFENSTNSGFKDLYTGTQESVNTFFIKLELITGLCGPWRLAKAMGVELEDPGNFRVPSFTLGVSDVSPLEMAEAYATFPARGLHCTSIPVLEIRGRSGELLPTPQSDCNRVMKPAEADAVNDVLAGVQERGGFGYGAGVALKQPSAAKTGTVAPAKSVWFVGYTPNLTTASMIAGARRSGKPRNLDKQIIGGVNVGEVHGSTTAGPMWFDAMNVIQQWLPNKKFVKPDPRVVNGQTVPIPSYYGYSPLTVALELRKLGLNPEIAKSVNSSAPSGTVAYTRPSLEAVSGETVMIYTSNGYAPPVVTPSSPTTAFPPTPATTTPTFTFTPSIPTPGTPTVPTPDTSTPTPTPPTLTPTPVPPTPSR